MKTLPELVDWLSVVAGHYSAAKNSCVKCFYLVGVKNGRWTMSILNNLHAPRPAQRLWQASYELSEALRDLIVPAAAEGPQATITTSVNDELSIIRVRGIDMIHFVKTPLSEAIMPIVVRLINDDPTAAAEMETIAIATLKGDK